jgi:hypothetical protein
MQQVFASSIKPCGMQRGTIAGGWGALFGIDVGSGVGPPPQGPFDLHVFHWACPKGLDFRSSYCFDFGP